MFLICAAQNKHENSPHCLASRVFLLAENTLKRQLEPSCSRNTPLPYLKFHTLENTFSPHHRRQQSAVNSQILHFT